MALPYRLELILRRLGYDKDAHEMEYEAGTIEMSKKELDVLAKALVSIDKKVGKQIEPISNEIEAITSAIENMLQKLNIPT